MFFTGEKQTPATWTSVENFQNDLDSGPITTQGIGAQAEPALVHGGIIDFAVSRYSCSEGSARIVETLAEASRHGAARKCGVSSFPAYWLPQGKKLEIPETPGFDEPKLLLTPEFSGCSLVVEKLAHGKLQVSHVVGGKHHEQFEALDIRAERIASAFTFQGDYGKDPQIFQASAFMQHQAGEWKIHWQRISGSALVKGDRVLSGQPLVLHGCGQKSSTDTDKVGYHLQAEVLENHAKKSRLTPLPNIRWSSSEKQPVANTASMGVTPSAGSESPFARREPAREWDTKGKNIPGRER
jgi:hypothetical protein